MKYFAIFTLVIATIAGSGASFAQEISRLDDLVIERQWARASIGTRRPAAAYLSIRNKGTENDPLLEVSTPLSGMAEVHTMKMKNGVMKMGPAGSVEIPAGGKVVREAGPMKHGNTVIAFVEDPDGYKIELIQRKGRVD